MSTKAVRLDSELMKTLAEKRKGFETPNECLKRLLNGKSTPCTPADADTDAVAPAEEVEDSES